MRKPGYRHGGFSLIELSVVLVIIGVVVAGMMYGKNLLRGSRVVGVIQEADRYKSAFLAFNDKYQQLPGDMVDGYITFADGASSKCGDTAAGGCNGDGDGIIEFTTSPVSNEAFRAWQHLQLAGFIEGRFSGVPGTSYYQPGTNLPASAMQGAPGYSLYTITATGTALYGLRGQFMRFATANSSTAFDGPALSVQDALTLEKKLDDGVAGTGVVLAEDSATTANCVDGSNVYVLDETTNGGNTVTQCRLAFLLLQTY